MINTVLFDMDGLLLDTEPLWGKSMLHIASQNNIPITKEKFKETTGLRIYEVTEYWAIKYPWQGKKHEDVAEDILDDIIASSKTNASVLTGVISALEMLRKNDYKIGLASSSPMRMIDELVTHFNIKEYFHCITSADVVALGKPHPAVFLHCANTLNSKPIECLVLEDSLNGIIAGKAARMKVVAIPDAAHYEDPRFTIADATLKTMNEFDLAFIKNI